MENNEVSTVKDETVNSTEEKTKFCKHCGTKIPYDAVVCNACGRQVEMLKESSSTPQVIINNSNTNSNVNQNTNVAGFPGKRCNKWVSFFLCLFLGVLGGHKFYEGKAGMGILYLFTVGLFGIGVIVDLLSLLAKPNPYYVY